MKIVFFVIALSCISVANSQTLPDGISKNPVDSVSNQPEVILPVADQAPGSAKKYERKATDLILFPEAKKTILDANYQSQSNEYVWRYEGEDYANIETTTNSLNLRGLYAINDKIAVGATVSRVIKGKSTLKYGSASTKDGEKLNRESSGFRDVVLEAVYRVMDVSRDRYDMNVGVLLSPGIREAKDPSESKDGNAANGGNEYSLFLKWGRRNLGNQWSVGFQLNNFGESKSKDASTKDVTKTDSYSTIEINGDFQWLISNRFIFGLNMAYQNLGKYTITFADDTYDDYDDAPAFTFGATGNFLITDDTYIKLKYEMGAASDRDITGSDGTVISMEDLVGGVFTIGVLKQF